MRVYYDFQKDVVDQLKEVNIESNTTLPILFGWSIDQDINTLDKPEVNMWWHWKDGQVWQWKRIYNEETK